MRVVRSRIAFTIALFVGLAAVQPANAVEYVQNGDFFAFGLNWVAEGTVTFADQTGTLTDAGSISGVCDDSQCSRLSQRVSLESFSAAYTVQFDFLNLLTDNPNLPNGDMVFPDLVTATLYLTDDSGLNLNDPYSTPFPIDSNPDLALLTSQYDGNTPSAAGTISASAKGGDWLHYTQVFDTTAYPYAYAYIVFELFGLDTVPEESFFKFDNVSISRDEAPIPEPATLSLLSVGLLSAFGLRRKSGA